MHYKRIYLSALMMVSLVIFLLGQDGQCQLKLIKQKKLPLDEETGIIIGDCFYSKDQNGEYLSLLYYHDLKLNIYDFKNEKIIKSFQYKPDGINGVGSDLSGFCFLADNKVAFYLPFKREIAISNLDNGNIEERIKLNYSKESPNPQPDVFNPVKFIENKFYLSGALENHYHVGSINPLVEFNVKKKQTSYVGPSIKKAGEMVYGELYTAGYDYNSETKKFIISHSICDSIEVSDLNNNRRFQAKERLKNNL